MSQISKEEFGKIMTNAPKGTDPKQLVQSLQKRGYTLEGLSPIAMSSIPKTEEKKTYTAGEALGGAVQNIIPSTIGLVGGLAKGVGTMIAHPLDTGKNVWNMAEGTGVVLGEKVNEMFGRQSNLSPEDKQKEMMASNVGKYFVDKYGGWENVKRSFAEDPASVLFDASMILSGGETGLAKLGEISKIGAIAKAGEVAGKVGKVINPITQTAKIAGKLAPVATRVAGEAIGAATGTGYGVIKQFYNAVREGGTSADEAYKALRGDVSAEEVVGTAKDALGQMKEARRTAYQEQLKTIEGDKTVHDIEPIKNELTNQFDKFKVDVDSEGKLDFSRSSLRFNKVAQQDIQTIYDEMKTFGAKPEDLTTIGLDNLKQAFGDVYSQSSKARAFVQGMTSKVRETLSKAPGYDKLAGDYSESTKLIDEIQKNLSLGNKTMMDTAYRKLSSVMRTNNELRLKFANELNELSGGKLLPQIAGQQLSEVLPRGLMKPMEAVGGVGALAAGVSILPVLKALVFTSPRIMGEVIGALGFTGKKAEQAIEIIKKVSPTTIKEGVEKGKTKIQSFTKK
jgi:hypothetical protein